MSDLRTLLPLAILMMLPLWIPVAAATIGMVRDRLRPPTPSRAQAAVERAKLRADESPATRLLA